MADPWARFKDAPTDQWSRFKDAPDHDSGMSTADLVAGRRPVTPQQMHPGQSAGYYKAYQSIASRKGAGDATPSSRGFAASVGNGMTFGLADEAAGGAAALGNMLGRAAGHNPGYTPAEEYAAQRDYARDIEAQYAQKHPVLHAGAQIAGAVANPITEVTGGWAGKGATLGAKIVRGAVVGGGLGAAAGAGNAQGGLKERAVGAGKGAVAGAAVGAVVPVAASVAGTAAQGAARVLNPVFGGRLVPANAAALSALQQALKADGVTGTKAAQAIAAWRTAGNDAPALLDIGGQNTMRLLRGAAGQAGGDAGNAAVSYADQVTTKAGARGQARVRALVPGGPSANQTQDFLGLQREQNAATKYAEPYAQTINLTPDVVSALSDDVGNSAIAQARAGALARRDYGLVKELDQIRSAVKNGLPAQGANNPYYANAANRPPLPPISGKALDRIQIALKDMSDGALRGENPNRTLSSGLLSRRAAINGALDAFDGLKPARADYADMSRSIDAVETGQTVRTAMPDDFKANLGPNPSPNVLAATRLGARQALTDSFGQNGQAPGLFREMRHEPNLQSNLADTFGPETQNALANFGANESMRLGRAQMISPTTGSQTQLRGGDILSMIKSMGSHPIGLLLTKVMSGAPMSEAERAAVVHLATQPINQLSLQALAPSQNALQAAAGKAGSYLLPASSVAAANALATPQPAYQ